MSYNLGQVRPTPIGYRPEFPWGALVLGGGVILLMGSYFYINWQVRKAIRRTTAEGALAGYTAASFVHSLRRNRRRGTRRHRTGRRRSA